MKKGQSLYFQVILGILIGIFLGYFFPATAVQLKPLGDGFIKLIKMLIGPIIFFTVVLGVSGMGDMKKLGRVGLKSLVYFEVLSTVALLIGFIVIHLLKPGAGMNVNPATLDTQQLYAYAADAKSHSVVQFLLNIIPASPAEAFAQGDVLQILLFSLLFGVALSKLGARTKPLISLLEQGSHVFFEIVSIVIRLAPIGAMGAMAFTVGKFGIGSLASLGKLMGAFYLTCFLFIAFVLGGVCRYMGFGIWKFIAYIKDEILIVLGTSSSESVLPRMMTKLEDLGCDKSVVGLVIPAGYSFNLDGTSIYLTMAALFVAQACNVHLSIVQELTILAVLVVSSKGAAGVTGSGFITLAATLSAIPSIPVEGLVLILGIDRFMSEARAITNLIGNGVATIAIAKWEKEFDAGKARGVLG